MGCELLEERDVGIEKQEKEEAEQRGAGGAWRREWPKLRQEELYLQELLFHL